MQTLFVVFVVLLIKLLESLKARTAHRGKKKSIFVFTQVVNSAVMRWNHREMSHNKTQSLKNVARREHNINFKQLQQRKTDKRQYFKSLSHW